MIDLSGQWEIEKWSVRWLQALSLLLLLQSGSPDSSQILTAKDSKYGKTIPKKSSILIWLLLVRLVT